MDNLDKLDNNEVIKELTSIKGIGQWTAEMFFIFSLERMDVLSLGDVGLQSSCKWLYSIDKTKGGKKILQEKSQLWKPYFSVASLYLWEAINCGFVDQFNSIDEVILSKI
ncbi:hypothetical protein BGM25_24015 [Bacillus sp. FJAT-29953]|nr:hypothetical protein [Bacillus sp. FJAT-29953]